MMLEVLIEAALLSSQAEEASQLPPERRAGLNCEYVP